ncbi:MAG: type II secretion system protein GspG [Thermomicrobiales bacterium]|nr:type II secretion system protein GspG [Thermomicrobiales bacterium]
MSVRRIPAWNFHLLRLVLVPALKPFARLFAVVGLSLSALIVYVGSFGCPPPDWNRLRYLDASLQVQAIREAVERYRSDCGDYPPVGIGLGSLVVNPGVEDWRGPYLEHVPLDPWQQSYLYSRPAGPYPPEILSHGADRKPGGTSFDTDISSLRPKQPIPNDPRHTRRRRVCFSVWIGAWISTIACGALLVKTMRRASR